VAGLQQRNGGFRIIFRYQGKQRTIHLGGVSREEAEAKAGQVDLLLLRLKQRLIELPPGVTIEDFLINDGQIRKPEQARPAAPVSFATFKQQYLDTHGNGAMETNSLATVAMHLNHFERSLGHTFPLTQLTLTDLQQHVNQRAKKKIRGKPLSPVTLKKEMASFRAAWNWAALTGIVQGAFPAKGLVYPKADEKPPFMTWDEIELRLKSNTESAKELWDALFLRKEEMDALLEFVKDHGTQPWVYPLFCTAVYTGSRRSELLRILVADVNFEANTILIREKKRSRKQRTTRHVSLSPFLKDVLRDWLKIHPGGTHLFCQEPEVARSKSRSRTTGHKGMKARASSLKGRQATVRRRDKAALVAVTRDEAHDHFKRTLARSKWEVLRGFHVLRHSFISCLAAAGVDQRIIDDWTGHSTEEQRRRYRHLLPDLKQKTMQSVFG
jgi:integrase